MDFTASRKVVLDQPEVERLPGMLVEPNGIGIISVCSDPYPGRSEGIEKGFNGQVEKERGNWVPLGNPFADGKGGA